MSKVNPNIKPVPKINRSVRLAGGYGAPAANQKPEALLRRAVMACLLWEDLAYESGEANADNIAALIPQVKPNVVAETALEAREKQKLRHVPLFIASEMARYKDYNILLADLLPRIITRADQITDFVAIYWKQGKQPITNQIKKGLARSFSNFNEYQLAKYDRDGAVKLRDVLFLVHPKPRDAAQQELFSKIANRELAIPDTWEVEISASQDKKASWTRLITEKKLGAMAFLRNLNNLKKNEVDHNVIREGFKTVYSGMLLPSNFLQAWKNAPEFEKEIEELMIRTYSSLPKLPGKTKFVIDVSGSMWTPISNKSTLQRWEVACALAILSMYMCESLDIYCTAGDYHKHKTQKTTYPIKGFGFFKQVEGMYKSLGGRGIFTRQCLQFMKDEDSKADRIIVFSDSQDCDSNRKLLPAPFGTFNYIADVSSHKHGINYRGVWSAEVSGWSEQMITFIAANEGLENKFVDQ